MNVIWSRLNMGDIDSNSTLPLYEWNTNIFHLNICYICNNTYLFKN